MRSIVVTAVVTIALAVGFMYWLGRPLAEGTGFCTTRVGTTVVETDLEQTKWATQMAAIAAQRGLPPRATTIAIATAYQESKMRNIDYGDRDSLGLFQQRPSQGWGSNEQVTDPVYAINAFYDGLIKVKGYETMEITVAAQKVQRSAFPDAYAQHEANARALASALRGHSPAAFTCSIADQQGSEAELKKYLAEFWPNSQVSSKDGTHTMSLSVRGQNAPVQGWAIAHFLVGNAAEFGIATVAFDDMRWASNDSKGEWVPTDGISRNEVTFTLN